MKRSTSILLYVLLPFSGRSSLRSASSSIRSIKIPLGSPARCPPAFPLLKPGLSCRRIKLRSPLFPRPAASVSGLTIRTPAMTLFVDEGTVYPDFWALLHGETRIAGVRLLKPTLLLEPPAGTTPDATQQPRFSIPPQLAEMDIDLEDGTIASLLPGANKSGIHSQWQMSGISGSATVPGNGDPGELSPRWARWNGTETRRRKRTGRPPQSKPSATLIWKYPIWNMRSRLMPRPCSASKPLAPCRFPLARQPPVCPRCDGPHHSRHARH